MILNGSMCLIHWTQKSTTTSFQCGFGSNYSEEVLHILVISRIGALPPDTAHPFWELYIVTEDTVSAF